LLLQYSLARHVDFPVILIPDERTQHQHEPLLYVGGKFTVLEQRRYLHYDAYN
jgi:hypothetical protein